MKKKIIALILLIPLLLVFTTFSLANVVVLTVPVPVSGVKLLMNEVEYLDVTEGGTLKIKSEVYPDNAKEKGVVYSSKKVEGKTEAQVSIDAEGNLKALSLGSANIVVTTKDGGYKAGFLLEVSSKSAVGLAFLKEELSIKEGETASNPAIATPFSALDKNVEYRSEDETVAKVNAVTGAVTGLSAGETVVTATIENGILSADGTWVGGAISTAYRVTVSENEAENVVVNGKTGSDITEYAGDVAELVVSVSNSELSLQNDSARNKNFVDASRSAKDAKEEKLSAFYRYATFTGGSYTAEIVRESKTKTAYRLSVQTQGTGESTLKLGQTSVVKFLSHHRLDALSIFTARSALLVGERLRIAIETLPEHPDDMETAFQIDNDDVAELREENGKYYLIAKTEGVFTLRVTASVGETMISEKAEFNVHETPGSINFRLNTKLWGIKERFAFASKKYVSGIEAKDTIALELVSDRPIDVSLYEFISSDPSVAQMTGNRLSVLGNGTATITAKLKSADDWGLTEEYSATLLIDCVDGVNVSDYAALTYASAAGRKIVLQSDVMVGTDVSRYDLERKTATLNSELTVMDTTADWSYYKNSGQTTVPPTIKVAVEFKDDVYGNGFTLNAHNITAVTDSTGAPIQSGFTGPLNMVAVNVGGLGASVKAQDNIVFLVKNDNVKIDNVELMSRNLEPNADGLVELNDLNYAGTTLEIMGDNVNLLNSRVRNGRTAVRIFGGSDPDRKINVRIESCILSYAREFTLKIGTNRTLASTAEALQPDLTFGGKTYFARDDKNFDDTDFVREFLKTDVTVKNTVFTTSGIFPVGIESKFGGSAFREGEGQYYFAEWKNASGTSYAARLNLEGDVGLYDWKDVDSIDSGTLIETTANNDKLNFDISQILKSVRKKYPDRFGSLLTDLDGVTYAHGGIAFYGGGKNYSCVDVSGLDADCYLNGLKEVSVPLTIIDGSDILVAAAGKEPFRFYMFATDSEMNVAKQTELLGNGTAYDAVKPAIDSFQ